MAGTNITNGLPFGTLKYILRIVLPLVVMPDYIIAVCACAGENVTVFVAKVTGLNSVKAATHGPRRTWS